MCQILSTITKFGVVIQQDESKGEVLLAIVGADSSGNPDVSAPLYEGTLIAPTTTATWYYEESINVPVTIGTKYWVLIDGYDNTGATGASYIGLSDNYTDTGENFIYSNNGGSTWDTYICPLAIYVEGLK